MQRVAGDKLRTLFRAMELPQCQHEHEKKVRDYDGKEIKPIDHVIMSSTRPFNCCHYR